MTDQERLKLVIVGDATVGKTSLITKYCTGEIPGEYGPHGCYENYTAGNINLKDNILFQWVGLS